MFQANVSLSVLRDRVLEIAKTLVIHGAASMIVGVIVALAILIVLGNPMTIQKIEVAAIGAQAGSLTSIFWAILRGWIKRGKPNP